MANSQSERKRWSTQCVCRVLWRATIAGAGLAIAILTYRLSTTQDVRERMFHFHELALAADKLYCETQNGGVHSTVQIYIDRAAKLEPDIRNELVTMDYICLATIGSCFWSHDETQFYGKQALRMAESSGNRIELYAAHLVLGHLAFLRYKESRSPADLEEGRQFYYFAKRQILDDESPQNQHLACQLYLQWGEDELYVDNAAESEVAFAEAREALKKASPAGTAEYSIRLARKSIRDGYLPRLPCPSKIAVIPAVARDPSTQETQFRVNDGEVSAAEAADVESSTSDGRIGDRVTELENGFSSLNKTLHDEIGNIKDLMRKASAESVTEMDGRTQDNRMPDPPADKESPISPRMMRPRCLIQIYNNTSFVVHPIISGYDDERFSIQPRQLRKFYVGCEPLSLKRRDTGNERKWNIAIFQKLDGTRTVPFFEATNCCFEIRQL